jgi:hypothetical protein
MLSVIMVGVFYAECHNGECLLCCVIMVSVFYAECHNGKCLLC